MACGTRSVYPSKRNKGLSSTFQPPEEGRNIQRLKRCDKHGDKDQDNSPKNVNNVKRVSFNPYGWYNLIHFRIYITQTILLWTPTHGHTSVG